MLMNRDAEIASIMLFGQAFLALIALSAAFLGIYIAMTSTYLNSSLSLYSIAASAKFAYLNQVRIIDSISHNNQTLANSLLNNSTADTNNLLGTINQTENQIEKSENSISFYPIVYLILMVVGGIGFAYCYFRLNRLRY